MDTGARQAMVHRVTNSWTRLKRHSMHCCSAAQSCLTLCDPMDCSPPGSSIHGIFQARVLEWGAITFSDTDAKVVQIEKTGVGNMESLGTA